MQWFFQDAIIQNEEISGWEREVVPLPGRLRNLPSRCCALLFVLFLLTGCGASRQRPDYEGILADAMAAAASEESGYDRFGISAPGGAVIGNDRVTVDCSNTGDGYILLNYTAETDRTIRLQLEKDGTVYAYYHHPGSWEIFPLTEGSGSYRISVFENVEGSRYAVILSEEFSVEIRDEFSPFLLPNQYVNYAEAPTIIALAARMERDCASDMEKINMVYGFVMNLLSYDTELAADAPPGYLPDLETLPERRKGICFDYAALMTALLRLQKIPCRLVTGYAGGAFHAWISVWTEESGWLDAIRFDETGWHLADPTFGDTGMTSREMAALVGDGSTYLEKNFY